MPRATWLVEVAKQTGYPVVEVAGWAGRGHGDFRSFEGVVGHHTGTAQTAQGDYPSLNIVTNGRSDLPGPLCNYGLGRSGTIYCVAAGVGWHAGTSSFAGFTNLNDKFLGIEAEHAGGILPWPTAQLDAYAKLIAAILRTIGKGQDRYCSHRTCAQPAGRKPDPRGIDDAWMRGQVARLLGNSSAPPQPAPGQEDDMFTEEDRARLTGVYHQMSGSPLANQWPGWPTEDKDMRLTLLDYLRRNEKQMRDLRAEVADLRKRLD